METHIIDPVGAARQRDAPWTTLFRTDIGLWAFALAVLLLATGLVRLARRVRFARRGAAEQPGRLGVAATEGEAGRAFTPGGRSAPG